MEHADQVISVYIIDPVLLVSSASTKQAAFLFGVMHQLDADLRARGSRLIVRKGLTLTGKEDLVEANVIVLLFSCLMAWLLYHFRLRRAAATAEVRKLLPFFLVLALFLALNGLLA